MNELPEELIESICSNANKASRKSLSLVSKKLHRIVEPFLCRRVHLEFETADGFLTNAWEVEESLKRTASSGPLIKRLSATSLREGPYGYGHPPNEEFDVFESVVRLLPNLEEVDLLNYSCWLCTPPWLDSRKDAEGNGYFAPMQRFDHLKRLFADIGGSTDLDDLYSILSLPNLETLELQNARLYDAHTTGLQYWAGIQSNVKRISFRDLEFIGYDPLEPNNNSYDALRTLFRSCPALEDFEIIGVERFCGSYCFGAVLAALVEEGTHSSIRRLALWDSLGCSPDAICKDPYDTANLQNMDIVDLSVDVYTLSMASTNGPLHCVAKTLKSLTLKVPKKTSWLPLPSGYYETIARQLQELGLSNLSSTNPHLEKITVCHEETEEQWIPDIANNVREQGIKYSVQKLHR